MKKLTAAFLFVAFAVAPVCLHAQAGNDAARTAAQKHNAKLARKQMKAREHAMRKAMKSRGKALHRQRGKASDGKAG